MLQEIALVFAVNNEEIEKSDAIICLEGDNYVRADKAYELFKKALAPMILISGGLEGVATSMHAQKMKAYLISKGISENAIELEEKSQNTHDQAREVIKIAKEKNWRKVILVASEFHQLRAFLTFLKEKNGYPLKIYNAPSKKSWFDKSLGKTRLALLVGELRKIKEYQIKSHVATAQEALNYQAWKKQA